MFEIKMSIICVFVSSLIWVAYNIIFDNKNKNKMLGVIMLMTVIVILLPLTENVKNTFLYPLLGGCFMGEIFLKWIKQIKSKFISKEDEENFKRRNKPSKISIKNYDIDDNDKKVNKDNVEHIIISDKELAKRDRIKKRYNE